MDRGRKSGVLPAGLAMAAWILTFSAVTPRFEDFGAYLVFVFELNAEAKKFDGLRLTGFPSSRLVLTFPMVLVSPPPILLRGCFALSTQGSLQKFYLLCVFQLTTFSSDCIFSSPFALIGQRQVFAEGKMSVPISFKYRPDCDAPRGPAFAPIQK